MTIIRSVSLTERQDKWLKKRRISISRFVREKIDREMQGRKPRKATESLGNQLPAEGSC